MSHRVNRDARTAWVRALSLIALAGLVLSLTACSGGKKKDKRAGDERNFGGNKKHSADKKADDRFQFEDEKSNSNSFDKRVDNPFFAAARTPLSTFSIDVDTASYSIVRR